uniref:Stress-response A/B barrel domain-containing protein n=1 Tax=Aegilops tauschii subsp. strangulata TaxID=200361 RepID=A0A453JYY3_AEGTS
MLSSCVSNRKKTLQSSRVAPTIPKFSTSTSNPFPMYASPHFESEVEDDIIPLFRRGEDFNYGVEFMLLISFLETASRESVEDALAHLQKLIIHYSSFIVQATSGCCLDHMDSLYSHASVIRFPSIDDFKLFKESTEYKDVRLLHFHR